MRRNLTARIGSVALVVPLAVGCATDSPSVVSDAEMAPAGTGCGIEPPVAPGESASLSMSVGELEREFVLHLPPDYDAARPIPMLLDFHGYTGTAVGEEEYTGLSRHADGHGYIVVYPQGTGFTSEDGQLITSWNDLAGNASPGPEGPICSETAFKYPSPPECGEPTPCNWATCNDDLGFIDQMLDRLEAELCVDLDRIYASGMSAGGMFVHRLGCDMSERFAAIAPVSGTLVRGFNCAPDIPLAMMNIYGSQDDYVSEKGDMSSDGYFYESAEDVLTKWAAPESQDCDADTTAYPTSRDGTLDLACVEHANCSTGTEVVHCTWDGAHDWPQAEGQPFGNDIIWEFLSKHTRAAQRAVREEGIKETP